MTPENGPDEYESGGTIIGAGIGNDSGVGVRPLMTSMLGTLVSTASVKV